MKAFRLPLLALLAAAPFAALRAQTPTSDALQREARPLPPAASLALNGSVAVDLRQGEPQRVEVEANAHDLDFISTTVENGELRIGVASGPRFANVRLTGRVVVHVTLPTLNAVAVAGSGSVKADPRLPFKTDNLAVQVHGSGGAELPRVQAKSVAVQVTGSGSLKIGGQTADLTATLSGSGSLRADELQAQTATVKVTGSGSARVAVSETLNVQLRGSGSVAVKGKPRVTEQVTGSGRVRLEQ